MAGLIASRYEPLEVVGQGAQGQVVRALDHRHRRQVAVKLRPVDDGEHGEALVGEAGILLGLQSHPRLPVVREDFFDEGRYCIVMDWVDGVTLARRLGQAGGALGLEEVLGHLAQVAEALDHLHAHDPPVVHGDVKPANILLTEAGAVLVDFGISRRGGSGPAPSLGGTRGYRAPELALGGVPTPAADVFGLAATAFALLSGEAPHPGARPPWRRIAGEAARQVEFALRRGLAVDPTRRPPSAGALVAALAPGASPPNPLPLELTSFVGRRGLLDRLGAAVGPGRLVTLSGAGGMGKSRLVRQLAAEAAPAYPDGAYLVELAPLAEPALVPEQVLAALGARQQPTQTPTETLVTHLLTRRLLLVLDNCEHLLRACAELVDVLRATCVGVALVATTRQPLGVDAEKVFVLGPLQTPAPDESDVGALAGTEAVQLFVDRAAQAKADFALTPANAAALGSVCRRLDGIPLALELAAARVNVLSVPEIARRLDDRFRLLAGGPRSALPRHQTLRATLEWSHDALSATEGLLFDRLSVFAGGFELDAAAQVCAGEGVEADAVPEVVAALVGRSLVVADTDVDTHRYFLLETMRQFGAERLDASGDAGRLKARHLDWALSVKERFDSAFSGPDRPVWFAHLDAEIDNVREALVTALATEPQTALRLITGLGHNYFTNRGLPAEGRRWLRAALDGAPDAPAELRGRAIGGAGSTASAQGRFAEAETLLRESVAVRRPLGRTSGLASSLARLGWACGQQGEFDEAASALTEAAEIAMELGDERGAMEWRLDLAMVWSAQGHFETARPVLEKGIELFCAEDDPDALRWLNGIGYTLLERGDIETALPLLERALARYRREMAGGLGAVLGSMGELALSQGDDSRAEARFEEELQVARRTEQFQCMSEALGGLGWIALRRGDLAAARTALADALRCSTRSGWIHMAVDLDRLAALAIAQGQARAGAAVLGATEALRERKGYPRTPRGRRQHEASMIALAHRLDPRALEEAWAEGRSMSTTEAVAQVLGEGWDRGHPGEVVAGTGVEG